MALATYNSKNRIKPGEEQEAFKYEFKANEGYFYSVLEPVITSNSGAEYSVTVVDEVFGLKQTLQERTYLLKITTPGRIELIDQDSIKFKTELQQY